MSNLLFLKEKVMQDTGLVEKTADPFFDVFVKNQTDLGGQIPVVIEKARQLHRCMHNVTVAMHELVESMGPLCDGDKSLAADHAAYTECLAALVTDVSAVVKQDVGAQIVAPLEAHSKRMKSTARVIHARKQAQVQYDAVRREAESQRAGRDPLYRDRMRCVFGTTVCCSPSQLFSVPRPEKICLP